MFSTVQHWGMNVLLPAALALLMSAEQARAQGRLQTRPSGRCQHQGGQAQLSSRQQMNALRNVLNNQLQQLNALQQTGLTAAQLQAASQLQSALQIALQQLIALQNSNPTAAQLQMLSQQQAAGLLQPRAAPPLDGP